MFTARSQIAALLLGTLLVLPSLGQAAVFICVDPATGEKTFTDRACPSAGQGQKVKVDPVNFGRGVPSAKPAGTWNSDRDSLGRTSRDISATGERHIRAAKSVAPAAYGR